jgi:hypothetical protein
MKRALSTLLWLGLTAGSLASQSVNATASGTLKFQVFLDDEPIGTHSFRLQERNDVLLMESEADFEVRFLFLTAYEYRHRSQELWERGCLKEIRSQTNDNGERLSVRGERSQGRFLISGEKEQVIADPCAMTFAYWDRRILEQERLINPQTGEVVEVDVIDQGADRVTVDGQEISARRYRLTADDLDIILWYDDGERWLGLESRIEDEYLLRYRPI